MDVKFTDLIYYRPNYLSKDFCDYLINEYENSQESPVRETSLNVNTYEYVETTFTRQEIMPNTHAFGLVMSVKDKIVSEYLEYLKSMEIYSETFARRLIYPHNIRILKYDVGQSIHPHVDFSAYETASCTFNLNNNYEGGDFCFWNGKKRYSLGIGDILFFPAGDFWIHEVEKVTKGSRYSVNMFLQPIPEIIKRKSYELTDFMNYISSFNNGAAFEKS